MILAASSHKVATAIVISTMSLTCISALASRLDNSPTALAALQGNADKAQPRDKCFLFAEFVSHMANLASQQFNAGDSERLRKHSNRCNGTQRRSIPGFPITARD
jgi:hypothetical protein